MRKLIYITTLAIICIVCTSCSVSGNYTDENKSGKSNKPEVTSNKPGASVSPAITPDSNSESESKTTNTATNTYVRKTPVDILYNVKSIDEAKKRGFRVKEDQSFTVELNSWGKVRFVSGMIEIEGPFKSCFFLTEDNGSVNYVFPDFYGNNWSSAYSIDAVSFHDINKDGLKDIIVIASYMTGVGSNGAIPFPVCGIYFQKGKEFIRLPSLEEEINKAGRNKNISMVMEFVEGKEIDIANTTSPKAYPTSNPTNSPMYSPVVSTTDKNSALDIYKAVLQSKVSFFMTNDKRNVYLDKFISSMVTNPEYPPVNAKHFTVLDMDEDKTPEVVIELSVNGNTVSYEILHYMNGTVIGYILSNRGLGNLKADGTSIYSSGASDWGVHKLTFTENTYEHHELVYCKQSDNRQTVLFFNENKPISQELFKSLIADQDRKKDVIWYELSSNNIEAKLSIHN